MLENFQKANIKDLIKSFSKLSLPTFFNLVASIAKNKILAIVIGVSGFGVYSQFVNLSALLNAIFPIGAIGITRYTSNYYHNDKRVELNSLLRSILIKNILFSVIVMFFFVIFSGVISNLLFSNDEYTSLLIVFSLTIPASLFFNLIDAYFKGLREINKYVLFLIINSIVGLVVNLLFIYFLNLEGAVIGLIITSLANSIAGFIILKKINRFPDFGKSDHKLNFEQSQIYKIGISTVIAISMQQITLLAIKSNIASDLSMEDVGLFQSIYAISVSYFGIFFAILATYSIPKISSFKENSQIVGELNSTIRFLMLLFTPLIVIFFVFRYSIISILYTDQFLSVKDLILIQLLGDFFRAYSWIFGLWLLPGLKIKQWLAFDIIYYVIFFLLFILLLKFTSIGLASVPVSYLCSYVIHTIINYIYTKKSILFHFSDGNLKQIILSGFLVIIMFFVSLFYENMGYFLLLPVLTLWAYLTITKQDLINIKNLINSKIKS